MQVTEEAVVISTAISVRWSAVKTLKVLNDKLLFVMNDGVTLEIRGLPAWRVDDTFAAYSKYLRSTAQG